MHRLIQKCPVPLTVIATPTSSQWYCGILFCEPGLDET